VVLAGRRINDGMVIAGARVLVLQVAHRSESYR